jgi:c-di-GMP-binding flagellar brake protein YcgR
MNDERRRYFRINDTLGVAYRVLTPEEVQATSKENNAAVNVFSLLANYDTQLNEQLGQLRAKDPALEQVLHSLNKKINCLINHLEMESRLVERLAHKIREVNISACGIAFVAEGELTEGTNVSLDIVLQPSETHIFSYGKVVGCEPDTQSKTDGYYVRINFHGMTNHDQELLIQHIVQRQSTQLRAQRPLR